MGAGVLHGIRTQLRPRKGGRRQAAGAQVQLVDPEPGSGCGEVDDDAASGVHQSAHPAQQGHRVPTDPDVAIGKECRVPQPFPR